MGTGRLRGAYAKSAARRDEILLAAMTVFSTAGYRSGSLREIADRVGMSQPGLLHHFGSKEALLVAVLERRDETGRQIMGREGLEGIEVLRALIRLVEYNQSVPGLVQLFCMLSAEATVADHPAHEYFARRYAWVLRDLGEAFAAARRAGDTRPDLDPAAAARRIVAVSDGLQIQWLFTPSEIDMAAELRAEIQPMFIVHL